MRSINIKNTNIFHIFVALCIGVVITVNCVACASDDQFPGMDNEQSEDITKDENDSQKEVSECAMPPQVSSYTTYNLKDAYECMVVYITYATPTEIKFYLSKESYNQEQGSIGNLLFEEQTAKYNGKDYYEYSENDYHIYFKYADNGELPSDKTLEVYGFESLYESESYDLPLESNGMEGNMFRMNVPFAG